MSARSRAVEPAAGPGGLHSVKLRSVDGARAEVFLQGAHVTSWCPVPDEDERLFLSWRSEFRAGAPIRGGIPVIFPQFAEEGPLPRHGFARSSLWTLAESMEAEDGDAVASFIITDSPVTRAIWSAEFRATLTVRVGGPRLTVALSVENTGASPFSFTCALHTYLRVRDIDQAEVVGLEGVRYRQSAAPTVLVTDRSPAVRADGELDRVYVNAPRALVLREPDRALGIESLAFPDVVLWNPGARRAESLADMQPDGERSMLCVEPAAVQVPITLAPGGRWDGAQTLDASTRVDDPDAPSLSVRPRQR
jgi:glucose-6-phosphate 1-epimerase